jgi:diacylglycerol O-acyltransferase
MRRDTSRRFSSQDAFFLYFDNPGAPMHLGSLSTYEGRMRYEALVEHLDARIDDIPRHRQRPALSPLHIGRPTWEDDPTFDIRQHVRRLRPRGGIDDEGLRELAAELFAPQLDRTKPMWELTLVEGLTGDRSAIIAKIHHCMIDGVAGVELMMALLDMSPNPAPAPPRQPWRPRPFPDAFSRLSDAFWDRLKEQMSFYNDLSILAIDGNARRAGTSLIARGVRMAIPYLMRPAPSTSLSARLTQPRAIGTTEMPFADVRAIRSSLGGTVNDVVLTILAGALGRYLDLNMDGRLPKGVRVLVPVNVRREEQYGAMGNRVSWMLIPLPVGVRDPVERLHVIRTEMEAQKKANLPAALDALGELLSHTPVSLLALAGRLPPLPVSVSNLVCTNVPGPMVPLYCIGHRMLSHYPLAPLSMNMGLNAGVLSYDQKLFWGLLAHAQVAPDVQRLASMVDEAFEELRYAAGVKPIDIPRLAEIAVAPGGDGQRPEADSRRPEGARRRRAAARGTRG